MFKVIVLPKAEKTLKKLYKSDKVIANRIRDTLREIETLEDPHQKVKALTGNLNGLWRYRVGDYRLICSIENQKLIVVVIDINHRKEVYHSYN